jgi:hypothetical protein
MERRNTKNEYWAASELEQIAIQRRRARHADYYDKMSDERWIQNVVTKESHRLLIQKDLRETWQVLRVPKCLYILRYIEASH